MEKVLTISIAAYNVEEFIDDVLNSLIIPSIIEKLEVLIIDDGSTDNTVEKCGPFIDKYPQSFKLVSKENGGWGSTVSKGIELATGKYFKLLDGDDYFENLEEFVRLLEKVDSDLVYTPYVTFYEDSDEVKHHSLNAKVPLDKEVVLSAFYFDDDYAMHSCTFKTENIKGIKITEHCFYTDVEYILKGILKVKTVYFSPIEVYYYRLGRAGQSASIEGYRKHADEHLRVLMKLLKKYRALDSDTELFSIFKHRLAGMVDLEYNILLHLSPAKKNAHTLKRFDSIIKADYPEFYQCDRKRVQVFRKFGIISYPFVIYR